MPHSVTLSPKIFFAHLDLTADANAHAVNQTCDLPNDSCYGDTFEQALTGKRGMNFSIAGNMDLTGVADQDTIMQSKLAVQNVPLIFAQASTIGSQCDFGLINVGQYSPQLSYGQVLKFAATGKLATQKWITGGKILWSPDTAVTGFANGAEVSIGSVSATQKLYVGIAIFAYTGAGSITVQVQSDTTGFPSPTVQKGFTSATGVTSEMPTPVDGAITDTFYRAAVTGFTATSVSMIVVAGIQ